MNALVITKAILEPVSYTHLDVYKRQELQVNGESGSRPYAIVIPIKKDAEWWGLDQDCLLYTSRCV